MKNNQEGSPKAGSMNNQKTNEDYNKMEPESGNPNELAFTPYTEVPQADGHDYGVRDNDPCEEGFCWLPTDPTDYMQARQPNEQLVGWVMVSL